MQVVAIVFETIHPPTWLKRESNARGWMRGDALQGEKSVEIALLELSDGGGTQSRGKPRSKLALRTTLKRCETPPLPSQTLHDPPMLYRNGRTITRGFSRREFGQLCRRDQPPPSLSSSSRLRYHGIMHGVCSCLHFHAIQNSRKLRTGRNI